MKKFFSILFVGLLLSGCSYFQSEPEKPFIFSYEYDSIEPQHEEVINEWLEEAKKSEETPYLFNYEMDGYTYLFGKGIRDFDISFLYAEDKGTIKVSYTLAQQDNTVLLKVKYNELLCCTGFAYEIMEAD